MIGYMSQLTVVPFFSSVMDLYAQDDSVNVQGREGY